VAKFTLQVSECITY